MRRQVPVDRSRRRLLAGVAFAAAALVVRKAAVAARASKQPVNIKAGSAANTLAEFVRQTGLQVLFEFDAIRNHSTRAVNGQFDAAEALGMMLEGSGLTYEFVNERTVSVRPRLGITRPAAKSDSPPPSIDVSPL